MIDKQARKLAEVALMIMGAFHDLKRPHADNNPLTMRQYQALIILHTNETLTLSEFCQKLNLAASTGTELANRMISLGFFAKSSDSPDKRQIVLHVTPSGREILQQRKKALTELFQAFLSPLSNEDQEEYVQCFERVWQLTRKYKSQKVC